MIQADVLSIQPGDRASFTNNPAFDASSIDIWNTLCHGGTLFVFTGHLADMEALVSFFRDKAITKAALPTAVLHQITKDAADVTVIGKSLQILIVGGEKLLTVSARALAQHAPHTRLINSYGPSEASIFTTTFEVSSCLSSDMEAIPIGRPIPNTSVYLLDGDLRPVEFGLPGEICIAGKGLAAGYGHQEQLTSNKFIVVNDLGDTGSLTHIYRTGDIGRFIPALDGQGVVLEFIGRNDSQIKINGQRIELEDVEAVLYSGSGADGGESQIDRAVVVLAEDDILVAYVVPNDSSYGSAAGPNNSVSLALTTKLLEYCQRKLPPYMVPRHIVITAKLPLTENGKVDRKQLAQCQLWAKARKNIPEPKKPADDIQSHVQACVGDVLGEHPHNVPLTTNFVAVGLLSVRAPKLLNALRTQFSMPNLPFHVLHKYPSVKALSTHLKARLSAITRNDTTPPNSAARREVPYNHDALRQVLECRGFGMEDAEDVYETTFMQQTYLISPSPHTFMVHQLVTARTDIDTFVKAIEKVISRHTALRSTIFDNFQRQVVLGYNQKLRDQIIHIYPAEEVNTVESIVKDESRYGLTAPGPLINFEVFRTTPPTLLILAQHAIMDAWGRDCLFRDLDHAIAGKSLPEPHPFRNYVDYSVAHSNNPEYITWHVGRIREVETIVPFPSCDTTTFAVSSYFGPHFMQVEHLPEMKSISQKYNIKPSTLLKVAFAIVKRHESKQDTILILQTDVCRTLPVTGITEICAPTNNIAIDRVDFHLGSSVLDLLRTTQRNQDKITDISIVNYEAVLPSLGKDFGMFTTSAYTFYQKGTTVYDFLQPGPTGAENIVGMEWSTIVDGDLVKVRVDHDAAFADRIAIYADQFFKAARWLAANIEARSIIGLEL